MPARPAATRTSGQNEVELFLDAERPQVQERLGLGGVVEVAGLLPQGEVRDEAGTGGDVLAQLRELVGQKGEVAERQAGDEHRARGRERSA